MLYQRSGFPEEQELVLCSVTNVQGHAVFARLEEYGSTGMIHISEVAPGRIRNIREFVKEGKVVVCKVLRINTERGHIDLSLRRVTEMQKRNKTNAIKNEQRAEKIVEQVAHQLKQPIKELYQQIAEKILKEYTYLHECFEEVAAGNVQLKQFGLPEKISTLLSELIQQRMKPPEVEISGTLTLTTYEPDGIAVIKRVLLDISENEQTVVTYLGGGKYKVAVRAPDYKIAEERIHKAVEGAIAYVEKHQGTASFARHEQ